MLVIRSRSFLFVGLGALCSTALFPIQIVRAQSAILDQARAAADELANDAAARTSPGEDAGFAGYRDGHFSLSDAAGNNTLGIGGFALFRYHASHRSDTAPLTTRDQFTEGFQITTLNIHADGSIGQPELTYEFTAELNASGSAVLQDAWVRNQFAQTPWSLRAGQFTAAILREQNVSQEMGLAVERSQVNAHFTQDFSQGLELGYVAQQFRAFGSFTDGFRSAARPSAINSPYDSPNEADYAFSLRGEWMFAGSDWDRFDHFSSWRSNSTYSGMIGAAVAYQSFGHTGASAPIAGGNDLTYTLDVSTQGTGWNAYAALVGNVNNTDGFNENKSYGLVLQGGYFVADPVELFGRYEWIRLDPLTVSGTDYNLNFLTIGANYFPIQDSHAIRLTSDIVYSINKTDGLLTTGDTTTGLLGDPGRGEVDLRLQVVVRF